MFMLLITATTGSFRVFDTIRVMTRGGPGTSTQVLVYYIYKQAFRLNHYGYGSAAAILLGLLMIAFTLIYNSRLGKDE